MGGGEWVLMRAGRGWLGNQWSSAGSTEIQPGVPRFGGLKTAAVGTKIDSQK